MIRTRQQSARRPNLESLEDRRLLSLFTVENTNSFGTGSLAQAIASANDRRPGEHNHFRPDRLRARHRRSLSLVVHWRSETAG